MAGDTSIASEAPEIIAARRAVRDFFPVNRRHEGEAGVTSRHLDLIRDAGLASLTLPPVAGASPASVATASQVLRLLGAADAASALVLAHHLAAVADIVVLAGDRLSPWLRDELAQGHLIGLFAAGPEFEGDAPRASSAAGDSVRLSGRKGFATGSDVVAWGLGPFLVAPDSQARPTAPQAIVALFPMADPAVRLLPTWDTMGMRAAGSNDLDLTGLDIPGNHVVWRGAQNELSHVTAASQRWALLLFASVYLGVCDAAAAYTRRVLTDRLQPDLVAPLVAMPQMQPALGDVDQQLRQLDAMVGWTVHRHGDPATWDANSFAAIAAMKDSVTRGAVTFVERCLSLLGGAGYYRRVPLERYYRDVRAGPLHPYAHHAVAARLGHDAAPHGG